MSVNFMVDFVSCSTSQAVHVARAHDKPHTSDANFRCALHDRCGYTAPTDVRWVDVRRDSGARGHTLELNKQRWATRECARQ